jgi:hypothetical protein
MDEHRTILGNVGKAMKTIERDTQMSEQQESKLGMEGLSRRAFLGVPQNVRCE